MEKQTSHNKLQRSLIFLLGLAVAVFVVSKSLVSSYCEQIKSQQEQSHHDEEDEKEEEMGLFEAYQAFLPTSAVSLDGIEPIGLIDINYQTLPKPQIIEEVKPSTQSYYRTLFRKIISVNAP